MDQQLRTILLIAGLAVLVMVYLWSRRAARMRQHETGPAHRKEPSLGHHPVDTATLSDEGGNGAQSSPDIEDAGAGEFSEVPAETDKIVSIRVAFDGAAEMTLQHVSELLEAAGMQFGQFEIFHYHPKDIRGSAVFSVASMMEPGTFDMSDLSSPISGVTFFMALPGPISAVGAFEKMLDTAQQLVSKLGGRLLDESGNKLSVQRIGYLRDEIVSYEHQRRLLQH
jgi:cell division protein ZipA